MNNVNPILSFRQSNTIPCKNFHDSKGSINPTFGGLRLGMEKQVYNSPETLQAMMGIYKSNDGIVGTFPREMVLALKEKGVARSDMSKEIKTLTGGISDAVKILREAEIMGAELANSFDVIGYTNKMTNLMAVQDMDGIQKLANSLYGMGAVPKKDMRAIEKRAEIKVEHAFKKTGILAPDGHVSIKRLGNGTFGNAFKISFRDGDGKKVFHDKVIKVFKNAKAEETAMINLAKKSSEYYSNMSTAEYVEIAKDLTVKTIESLKSEMGEEGVKMALEKLGGITPALEKGFEQLKNMTLDDYVKMYKTQMQSLEPFHGVSAEANRSMFLKGIAGNMSETNYIEQHFYDLKNEYGFMEMADGELSPVKRNLNIEKYGLEHGDLDSNVANTVNGRVVDVGGIISSEQVAKVVAAQMELIEKAMEDSGLWT